MGSDDPDERDDHEKHYFVVPTLGSAGSVIAVRQDPNLAVELDVDVVEVGGTVSGRIQRWPSDGNDNSKKIGKVKAVRVKLSWRTEGRGDRTGGTIGETTIEAAQFGQVNGAFSIRIPQNAPISYDGDLIRVIWQIEARTDRKLALDPKNTLPLLVVPRNGLGRYHRPHPLDRSGRPPAQQPAAKPSDGNDPFTGRAVIDDKSPPHLSDASPDDGDPFASRPPYLDDSSADG